MRGILFRGKSVETNEWVYGSYILEKYGNTPYICYFEYGTFVNIKQVEVIPETVGQFTGLTDMNGKKIFEGDIVSTKYKLGRGHYYVFEVYYNENLCHFGLTINRGSYTKNKQYDWLQLTSLKANKIEVIGNTHDNIELLKGNVE